MYMGVGEEQLRPVYRRFRRVLWLARENSGALTVQLLKSLRNTFSVWHPILLEKDSTIGWRKLEANLLIATTVTELGGGLVAADVEPLNGIHFFAGIGVTNVTDIGHGIVLGPKGTMFGSATATIPTNQSVRGGISFGV